jgi:hypothetical protein
MAPMSPSFCNAEARDELASKQKVLFELTQQGNYQSAFPLAQEFVERHLPGLEAALLKLSTR